MNLNAIQYTAVGVLALQLFFMVEIFAQTKLSRRDFFQQRVEHGETCGSYYADEVDTRYELRSGDEHKLTIDVNGEITVVPHVEFISGQPIISKKKIDEIMFLVEAQMGTLFKFKVEPIVKIENEFTADGQIDVFEEDDIKMLTKWRSVDSERKKLHIGFVNDLFALCGIATFPFQKHQGILVKANGRCSHDGYIVDPLLLTHELGHFFNLKHTHHGLGFNQGGRELVNRKPENCQYLGDGFCDTPADPNLSSYPQLVSVTGNQCNFVKNNNIKDAENIVYDNVDITNIMSYAPRVCQSTFTPEQREGLALGFYYRAEYKDGKKPFSKYDESFFLAVDPNPVRVNQQVNIIYSQAKSKLSWFDDGNASPGDLAIWTMDVEVRFGKDPKVIDKWSIYSYTFHQDAGLVYTTQTIPSHFKPGIYFISLPGSNLPPYRLIVLGHGDFAKENPKELMTFSPNPIKAGESMNVTISHRTSSKEDLKFIVFNSAGQRITEWDLSHDIVRDDQGLAHAIVQIPMNAAPGVYFVKPQRPGKPKTPAARFVVIP